MMRTYFIFYDEHLYGLAEKKIWDPQIDWKHCRGRKHSLMMHTDAASYWLYMAVGYVWKSWMLREILCSYCRVTGHF